MSEIGWSRLPPRAPQSWFEFLLDRSGNLLKEHIKSGHADPSPLVLCKQFLQKSITQNQPLALLTGEDNLSENQRTKQLRYLALVVASYTQWNLDEIQKCIPLMLQNLLMRELLKNYGITEQNLKNGLERDPTDKRTRMVKILFHRWVVRSTVKLHTNKGAERPKSRNGNVDNSHDEQIAATLQSHLAQSVSLLNQCLSLDCELEVPFPKPNTENPKTNGAAVSTEEKNNDIKNSSSIDDINTGREIQSTAVFDESIPIQHEDITTQICIDLGTFHFFQEDYVTAFQMFDRVFGKMDSDKELLATLKEARGYYIASAMTCNMSISTNFCLEEKETLSFKAERCAEGDLEGLIEVLIEDNKKKELSINYRQDLESMLMDSKRKDLVFKVMSCNAVRMSIDGDFLCPSFLSSLKFINKDEFLFLLEICADALVNAGSNMIAQTNVKLLLKTLLPSLSDEFSEIFQNDKRLGSVFESAYVEKTVEQEHKFPDNTGYTPHHESILLEECGYSYNYRDDPCFLKREIVLSTNPEYLMQLVKQLNIVTPSKENIMSFQCSDYADILSEIRDPNVQLLLHIYLSKARSLASRQEFGVSLSLLTSALDILNPVSVNQADPLPKKYIYLNIVSYLLNKKEWQFLIEEGGNFEGINDFIQFGYLLAAVSVGLSKAGDAVRSHALELWNTVINIITDQSQHTNSSMMSYEMPVPGVIHSPFSVTRGDLLTFIDNLKNNTVLAVLASCLTALLNATKANEKYDVKALYSHIWPTTTELEPLEIEVEDALYALRPLYDKIIDLEPRNIPWLKNRADIYFVEGKYRNAMMQYLEVGAMTSDVFCVPVPFSVWDDQVYQRMIECCMKQKQFSHIKTLSQPELNSCNSPDTLKQSANQRKSRFLRFLAKSCWS
eukprot:gene18551-20414_t